MHSSTLEGTPSVWRSLQDNKILLGKLCPMNFLNGSSFLQGTAWEQNFHLGNRIQQGIVCNTCCLLDNNSLLGMSLLMKISLSCNSFLQGTNLQPPVCKMNFLRDTWHPKDRPYLWCWHWGSSFLMGIVWLKNYLQGNKNLQDTLLVMDCLRGKSSLTSTMYM